MLSWFLKTIRNEFWSFLNEYISLQLIVCLGHNAVVSQLLQAGADPSVTVGSQTAVDIAQAFDQTDILNLLQNDCD